MTSENRLVHLRAEVARGQDSLRAARELLRLQLFNDAVARAYYAAFHFASAVLLTEGLEPRSHAGVGAMLGQYFVVNGRIEPALAKALSRLERFRGEADYNRFFVFTEQSAAEEVDVAQMFCESVARWLEQQGWAVVDREPRC